MKICTKCNVEYLATIEYFCRDSSKKDLLHSHCKQCSSKSKSIYHAKISPFLKEKRKEVKELYILSEEYRIKQEESKRKDIERKKRWAKNNRDKINAAARIYNVTKRIVSSEKKKEYKQREYAKMMSCPYKKMIHYYRVRINDLLKGNNKFNCGNIILFKRDEFISHIESLFEIGMNWGNHGLWHIDHIRPINSFDLNDLENMKMCWSLKNLQPMWALENLKKGAKL